MAKTTLARISITLPKATLDALDLRIVEECYETRSQAIVDMIHQHLIDDFVECNAVMVGTLTLLYNVSSKLLKTQLIDIQQQYLTQVISSLHIQLDGNKVLQVMLMQGVSTDLQDISKQFITLKGVIKGHLELMDAVMPPIPQNTD